MYFFYALMQILPNTVGYANWLSLRLWGRRVFADHYQDEESLRRQRESPTTPHGWHVADRLLPAASTAAEHAVSVDVMPLMSP